MLPPTLGKAFVRFALAEGSGSESQNSGYFEVHAGHVALARRWCCWQRQIQPDVQVIAVVECRRDKMLKKFGASGAAFANIRQRNVLAEALARGRIHSQTGVLENIARYGRCLVLGLIS